MARRRRTTVAPSSGIPPELTREGLLSPVWTDPHLTSAWFDAYGLLDPPDTYAGIPRALRDQGTEQWARHAGYLHEKYGGVLWNKLQVLGVPPAGSARTRARNPGSRGVA